MKSRISLSVVVNVQHIEYPTNSNVMKRELTVAMYGEAKLYKFALVARNKADHSLFKMNLFVKLYSYPAHLSLL